MLRTTTITVSLAAALALMTPSADAHPRLRTASPASGAVLKVAPREIHMKFSEGLIVQFVRLQLKDGKGRSVPIGSATLNQGDNTKLVVPIRARLAAGTYSVAWSAVSVDTHRISGSYSFKVAR